MPEHFNHNMLWLNSAIFDYSDRLLVDKPGLGKVLIGRGAVNQKGPEATWLLAALHAFKSVGRKLPVNLVFVAEGEEEIGSPHFTQVVRRPDILAALRKCSGVYMPMPMQALARSSTSNRRAGVFGIP
jgi:hypothetical protein